MYHMHFRETPCSLSPSIVGNGIRQGIRVRAVRQPSLIAVCVGQIDLELRHETSGDGHLM